MSRLIDADAFKKNNPRHMKLDVPYFSEETVEEVLDSEPTVDAIPTEWIRSWAARTIKFTDIYKKMFFKDAISYLLMDWEAAQRGAKSANDEWVEMVETMIEAEHKREEEKEE